MPLSLIKQAAPKQAQAEPQQQAEPRFSLTECAGRLVEISGMGGSAVLSAAAGLVLEAQEHAEPVAWVTSIESSFYPPDLDEAGIDLAALIVARGEPKKLTAMADVLLRSGGFGLIVIDGVIGCDLPLAAQTRLLGLAQKHETAIVFLTEKPADAPSLGSLVSLRGEARRQRNGPHYECEVKALKDKRRGPTWRHVEVRRGSTGLR
jgi:recombination protein RecA